MQLWNRALGTQPGPLTVDGKRRSAMRGYKHGMQSQGGIAMRRWLAALTRLLAELKPQS
jgi:hypothetical protein